MINKMIMGAYGIFIVGTLTSLISSGIWFGESERGIINQLAGFNVINVQSLSGFGIPKGILDFFNAACTIIGWQYPYLDNPVGFVFKLFLYVVSIGVVIGILELFIQVVSGAVGFLKSIISPV